MFKNSKPRLPLVEMSKTNKNKLFDIYDNFTKNEANYLNGNIVEKNF